MGNTKKQYDNLLKIKLERNDKGPIKGQSWVKNMFKTINKKKYNIGIPCGIKNNLFCVDIDIKKNGMKEFQKYTDKYGMPKCVLQRTPSGGLHLIFLYNSSNIKDNEKIKELGNSRGLRGGMGIDTRGEGGYFASWPSTINGKNYEYIKSFNDTELTEIPTTLLDWLLEKNETKKSKEKNIGIKKNNNGYEKRNDYKYIFDEEIIKELLSLLPDKYLDDYDEWLKITTILKNYELYKIWDEWSKQSKNYNEIKNLDIWNNNNGYFDLDYLVYIVNFENKLEKKCLEKYKIYTKITKKITFNKIKMNQKYIYDKKYKEKQFDYDIFKNYDTIIIKSGCGSGKTFNVALHTKKYIDEIPSRFDFTFLSLITRISMANQHINTFNINNFDLVSYQSKEKNLHEDDIVCCINSLILYKDFTDNQFKNFILYIDEVISFLIALTRNETINPNLRVIKEILFRIIKNAHKVIVSDALINDAVLEMLKSREDNSKIMIENEYKRFKDIKAIKINDENFFVEKIKEHCKNNEPFFFGCDSCKVVTNIYYDIIKDIPLEERNKYVLITADTDITINDASKELKDKCIFYSPSVTVGLDFNIEELQDVFIYIKGTSINPYDSYQQTCRTRNIKTLYYYCNSKEYKAEYKSLDEVIEKYLDINDLKIGNVCGFNREYLLNDEFFIIFCYNEYIEDIYNTNKRRHYEDILTENGFVLSEYGVKKSIKRVEKKAMLEVVLNIKEDFFNDYIKSDNEERKKEIYNSINKNIETLGLTNDNNETLIKFKDYIIDNKKLETYFKIKNLINNDELNESKINYLEAVCFKERCFNSINHKIKLLRELEKNNNINFLNVDYFNDKSIYNKSVNLNDELYKKIKYVFRTIKNKPTNIKTLGNLYRSMLINICEREIFKKDNKKKDGYIYQLDIAYIKNFIELDKYRNPNNYFLNYHPNIIKILNINE